MNDEDDFLDDVFEGTNWKEITHKAYEAAKKSFADELKKIAQKKSHEYTDQKIFNNLRVLRVYKLVEDDMMPAVNAAVNACKSVLKTWQAEDTKRNTTKYDDMIHMTVEYITEKACIDFSESETEKTFIGSSKSIN